MTIGTNDVSSTYSFLKVSSSLSLLVMEKLDFKRTVENMLKKSLYPNISVTKKKINSIFLLVTEIFEFKDFFNTFSTV